MDLVAYLIFGALAGLTAFRAARSRSRGEAAVWIAAVGAFAVAAAVAAVRSIGGFPDFVFYLVALVSVVSALRVVTQTNPVHSAVWLITVFLCMAVLFVLKRSEFLAMAQIIIYAGAIMVLYVFIIMFVDVDAAGAEPVSMRMTFCVLGFAAAFLVAVAPVAESLRPGPGAALPLPGTGSVERVGEALYFGAALPFEVVSLILLVALVGALLMGKSGGE